MKALSGCFLFPGKFVSSIINLILKKQSVFTLIMLPFKRGKPRIQPREKELPFENVFEIVDNVFMRRVRPFLELDLAVLV